MLSNRLKEHINRGANVNLTPVVIRTSEGRARDLSNVMASEGFSIRQIIPTFDMFSMTAPTKIVDELAKRDMVRKVFYDAPVPSPTPTPLDIQLRRFRSEGKGIIRNMLDMARNMKEERARTEPEEGWIPTSVTRKKLGAEDAKDNDNITGSGIRIAILDTGIPPFASIRTHPQLASADITAKGLTNIPQPDTCGHGTHVATTILGSKYTSKRNGLVMEGIAPAAIGMSIKVLQTPIGMGRDSDIIKGYEIGKQWNAHIFSLSLGSAGYDPDNVHEPVLEELKKQGHIVIVAAGNSGPNKGTISTPAGSPHCVAVASVNTNGAVAGFSSRGPITGKANKPDIASYGGDNLTDEYIYSTTSRGSEMDAIDKHAGNAEAALHGTSMATPHVSGIVALGYEYSIKQRNLPLTPDELNSIITKIGPHSNSTGRGLLTYSSIKKHLS